MIIFDAIFPTPAPTSRLPTPDSRLPTPDSRLPTPDSRLPTPFAILTNYVGFAPSDYLHCFLSLHLSLQFLLA
ncbi:MAG: hypothetical protein F6J90_11445 [Moorea sp. SIOASIH]|uniref:hypothetical protein n=1 Tax=Moorena sp. SIOASIH TaxID=2607817 RepID=UPI0013B868B1|nr:hypothetical protein [Moorena sp. SIOASIH]NEO36890.1 hypothetical protein [Moorena sp. SIOASIH]